MPRIGTPRPGNGGPRPGSGRPRKVVATAPHPPRPVFDTGLTFALWALNAPDSEISIPQKLKVAMALLAAEAKRPRPRGAPALAETDATATEGIYSPRATKPFQVIDGDR